MRRGMVKAAVVQAGPVLLDTKRTVEKAGELVAEAARGGAQVVVLPEAFVGGYPKGMDFGARVGWRTAEGREEFRRYAAGAVEVGGEECERLGGFARAGGVELVVGVVEREGGILYCTALFFGCDGGLRGKHRKVMPTGVERLIWGQGDGSTLTVVETGVGRAGAVICWENYMPMLRMAMYGKGVELYCAPTVDDREVWQATMRHIAVEGRCFVLSACQFVRGGDGAELIGGGSVIVSPMGVVLAGPERGGEAILRAELDLDEIVRAKFDLDVVGHYGRPDIFELRVREEARRAVVEE